MSRSLTHKQTMFVKEYLCDLNATQAAIRAGYSVKRAEFTGSDLVRNRKVAEVIHEAMSRRSAKTEITADRVLREVSHMALYDPADIAGANISGPQDIPSLPESVRRAIIGWSWDKQGNFILKLSPKTPSLELLGRHLMIWRDVGSKDNPLTMDSLSDEEIDARLSALEAKGK